MADAALVILILFWGMYWLILSPILCYYAIQFYQLRHTQIVRKRFYKLTVFLAFSSIFTITVYSPFYLLRVYYISLNKRFIIMDIIYATMYSFCIYSIATLYALRFWCLWYYVKWTKATLDAEWKIHISKEQSQNWFIINQEKYGTIDYASRIAAIYLISGMIVFCVPKYITVIEANNSLASIIAAMFNLLILITPLITGATMWFKTPAFNDSFDLVREHRLIARILAVLCLLYLSIYIAPVLGATEYTRWLLGNVMSAIFSFTVSMFPVIYAIRTAYNLEDYIMMSQSSAGWKSIRSKSPSNHSTHSVHSTGNSSTIRFSFDPIHRIRHVQPTNNISIQPQMIQCIGHDLAFGAFMSHLGNEFSMELLLCFVELTQFKQAILSIDSDDDNAYDIRIPQQQQKILENTVIPKSFIVYRDIQDVLEYHHDNTRVTRRNSSALKLPYVNNNGDCNDDNGDNTDNNVLNQYQIRGYILYCKYIDSSSEFQINVSDEESKTLLHKLTNRNYLNKKDLFCLYDKTLQELWRLLRHSFYRFIKTTEYKDLLQYLQ